MKVAGGREKKVVDTIILSLRLHCRTCHAITSFYFLIHSLALERSDTARHAPPPLKHPGVSAQFCKFVGHRDASVAKSAKGNLAGQLGLQGMTYRVSAGPPKPLLWSIKGSICSKLVQGNASTPGPWNVFRGSNSSTTCRHRWASGSSLSTRRT
jgi:hypothetical protein